MRRLLPVFTLVISWLLATTASAGGNAAPGQSASVNTALPTITGAVTQGQPLAADTGGWSGPAATYSFQWVRCDGSGAACVGVSGATGQSYTLSASDVGATVRVAVTATNKNGSTVAASNATGAVTALPTASVTTTAPTSTSASSTSSAGAVTALPTASVTTTAPTSTSASSTSSASFVGNAGSGDLRPWDNLDLGFGTINVSADPTGGTSPGTVRVANAPDGQASYELTVTPTAHASPASSSDSVYLWNYPHSYDGYGNPGVTTWYHARVYFPSGSYAPTTGEWNWLIGHHNDNGYLPFACSRELANLNFDVTTDYPVVSGQVGKNPRLKMRVMGGATCSPQTTWYDLGALQFNHWYDLLYQVTWSPSAGQVNAWLDGTQASAYRGPTLYTRPDGSVSYTNFELINYRLHASWNSTIYFAGVKVGSSLDTVQ